MMNVLYALFLMSLLIISGCSKTQLVPVYQLKLSPELTAVTPLPRVVMPFRYVDSLELNAKLLLALGQYNLDKAAIRKIEEQRK